MNVPKLIASIAVIVVVITAAGIHLGSNGHWLGKDPVTHVVGFIVLAVFLSLLVTLFIWLEGRGGKK